MKSKSKVVKKYGVCLKSKNRLKFIIWGYKISFLILEFAVNDKK